MIPRGLLAVLALSALLSAQQPRSGSADAADPSAGEQVRARRLNDTVAIRRGADRSERVLYSFDPTAELVAGDELEQGSGGQSTVVLSLGGLVELFSSGHLIIEQLSEAGDVLRFPVLTHAEITAGGRQLTCWLPGGTRCTFQDGILVVRVEPGRMRVRNDSGSPVELEGMLTLQPGVEQGGGRSTIVLERGEDVYLPLFLHAPTPTLGSGLFQWQGRSLRHSGGFALGEAAGELLVEAAPGGGLDVLTVGGVRVTLGEGDALRLGGSRRGPPGAVSNLPPPKPAARPGVLDGMTEISRDQYFLLRQAGRTDEELAGAGYWVPPEVVQSYLKWASRQAGAPAEKTTNDETEDSSP